MTNGRLREHEITHVGTRLRQTAACMDHRLRTRFLVARLRFRWQRVQRKVRACAHSRAQAGMPVHRSPSNSRCSRCWTRSGLLQAASRFRQILNMGMRKFRRRRPSAARPGVESSSRRLQFERHALSRETASGWRWLGSQPSMIEFLRTSCCPPHTSGGQCGCGRRVAGHIAGCRPPSCPKDAMQRQPMRLASSCPATWWMMSYV